MKKTIIGIIGIILAAVYTISQFWLFYSNFDKATDTIFCEEDKNKKFHKLLNYIPLSIAGIIGYVKGLNTIETIKKEMKKK